MKYFQLAAELGSPVAPSDLDLLLFWERAEEVEPLRWLRLAVSQGHAAVKGDLGVVYAPMQHGAIEDLDEASSCLMNTATKGYQPAKDRYREVLKAICCP